MIGLLRASFLAGGVGGIANQAASPRIAQAYRRGAIRAAPGGAVAGGQAARVERPTAARRNPPGSLPFPGLAPTRGSRAGACVSR